ncbi:Hypothetical predicted protein [Mytilus galloprovincialis]|uniref:Mab-21-like HhH/H2TH-like domain-containing protein n=1 Tax=Mytilus galloprovincialis TaxID=29158 RepID=A0A8B6G7Z1_MYTGA|nr:Hypothetical predicted protein [Mytilus galloprovincialis]
MNLRDHYLSFQFYTYVCGIVGSEEVVRSRREIFSAIEIVRNTSFATHISSGSKAEGIDLKCSDYDHMMYPNFIRVYESLNDVQYNNIYMIYKHQIPFVMDTNDTKPGFTKLKLVNKAFLEHYILNDWCETVGEKTYISSKRFREQDLTDNMVVHGPCQSTPGGEFDSARCLRCNEWITPAQHWIHRSRTAWQDDKLITSAVQYGVLFVPIGCKNSPNEDLQWRISFSVTEKLLVHSFSHTQLLCYALMKIILKDLIKPKHGDLLCSYFLKTIIFWLSEEINPSRWKPENMISCFLDCIRRLVYCVEYKACLHYFIPENNLFEDRFTDKEHKALLKTLRFIYESPWISVFETSTFQNFRLKLDNSHRMELSASALSCFCYVKVVCRSVSINSTFKRLGNDTKEIGWYILCVCSRETLESSETINLADKNKSFYRQNKKLFGHFKMSLQSDSVSSWLLLASLFYKCKRFRECLDIINYCLVSCTPDKIYLHAANSFAEQTVFQQMEKKWGLLHAFKYLMIDNVGFHYPFCLLPNELISLISCKPLIFPPVVYSYLLQFLCCHRLQDYIGKLNALQNLELTRRERYLIYPNEHILKIVDQSLEIVRALICS